METTWINATSFKVLRHPVPGSFGLHGMRAVCVTAENGAPEPGTAYVGYNEKHTMLVVLYVRSDYRMDVTKAYSGKKTKTFAISDVLNSRARLCDNTKAAMEKLLNQLLEAQQA